MKRRSPTTITSDSPTTTPILTNGPDSEVTVNQAKRIKQDLAQEDEIIGGCIMKQPTTNHHLPSTLPGSGGDNGTASITADKADVSTSSSGKSDNHLTSPTANPFTREGKVELRLLLPTKHAGAVIGKGGEVIKGLRLRYNAMINIPDKKMPERVLTIISEPDQLMLIFNEILPKIIEEQKHAEDHEMRIIVHQSHAGAVIGRAGSKIKELREKSNAALKVFSDLCPNSTDRVIQVTGNQEKISTAVGLICEYVRTLSIKGQAYNYDAMNYNGANFNAYGGYPGPLAGRGGTNMHHHFPGPPPQHQNNRGGPHMNRGGDNRPPYFEYNRHQQMQGGGPPMYNVRRSENSFSGPPPGFNSGPRHQSQQQQNPINSVDLARQQQPTIQQGGSVNNYANNSGEQITTSQVSVPSNLGGAIIGKGGEKIKQIRNQSGARIDVEPSQGNNQPERIITISGTYSQIQMAQYLLQNCLASAKSIEAGPNSGTGNKKQYFGNAPQRY
uniref:Heterogeneous nuclear ribonucleoprotein K n=1 Tax=Rhabditophanes sp. KR3021 TaxID=114890 RepID=A0AC35U0R2_9BILA